MKGGLIVNEIERFWHTFCIDEKLDPKTPYGTFSFGNTVEMANRLSDLVLKGIKVSTSSGYDLYLAEKEDIPKVGQVDIVLDGSNKPVCVVKNTDVRLIPFGEYTDKEAREEGEGDLSLTYWRENHLNFFVPYYKELGIPFSEKSLLVYEKFERISRH